MKNKNLNYLIIFSLLASTQLATAKDKQKPYIYEDTLEPRIYELPAAYNAEIQNRTKLINYVIAQEKEILEIRKAMHEAWEKCFRKETYHADIYHPGGKRYPIHLWEKETGIYNSNSRWETKEETKIVHRNECTEADIQKLRALQTELQDVIDSSVQHIASIVNNAIELSQVDSLGNTVINYCYTPELYNKLRELGAPFQIQAFLYFVRKTSSFEGRNANGAY